MSKSKERRRETTPCAQTKDALRKERDLFSAVIDTAAVLVVVLDPHGQIVRFNRACEQVTGYGFDEVKGKPFWDVFLIPEEAEAVKDVFGRLRAGQFPNEHENHWVTKDGRRRLIAWSNTALLDDHGSVEYIVGTGIDITERRQAGEQLRRLSRAVEQSPSSIVITDTAGNIEYVNPKFTQVTGYTFEEVVGKNPRLLKSGEMPPEEYENLWKTITSGGEWRGEFHNKKKNGELYWESASISPITDAHGVITHFLAVKEDITERKGMEESLKQSEARFRSLIENAPVGIAVARGGLTLYANSAYLRMFGYADEAELYGAPLTNQIAPPYREEIMERTRRREKGEAVPSSYETVGLRKDGSSFPFYVSVTRMELSDGPASIAFFTDITERKRAEEAVRDSEEKFRALLEFASVAIVIVDGHGLIQLVNAKAEEMFGYARRELLGHPVEVLLPERFRHTHVGLRGSYLSNPRPRPMNAPLDLWAVRKDGTEFPVEVGLSPVETKDGILVMSYLTDITERRRAEEALRAALRRAEEVDQLKTQLLSIVSHELRTPLTSIRGQTTTLLDYADQVTPEERLEALQIVDDEAERLDELISHLLDMSRLEAGKLSVELGATDVRPILIESVSRMAAHAPSHKLVVNLPPTLPPAQADPRRVVQVVSNLLDNAIKFSPPGATVTVDAEVDTDTVRVRVRDEGPGIAPEHLPHIFDRFYRVEETGVRTSGAGLGLAICKGLVEAMGGQVAVTSQVGQGSVFSFSLLRAQGV